MLTMEALRLLQEETEAEVFITGGFVRDLLRRKKNRDIDVVVRYLNLQSINKFLSKLGRTKELIIHRNHGNGTEAIRFVSFVGKDDTVEAQIAIVKGLGKNQNNPNATLKQDAAHRDFSINAMYLPINDLTPKAVIDFYGGKNDIIARQILTISSAKSRFLKSPIRIMRAFAIAARTGYTINKHVREAIREHAHLLAEVPAEAIRAEFEEILLSTKPSKILKLMQKLGVLKYIIPELEACAHCEQDKKYHKYNVFNHVAYTCDFLPKDLVLRLAGLFHDIGKAPTRKIIDGRATFHRHEVIGAKLTGVILKRLKFDNDTIEKVNHLVRMHMYHYTREYTDAAIRRFINNAGIQSEDLDDLSKFPLFQLRQAERLGNGYKTVPITPKQLDFEHHIIEVFKSSSGFTIRDLDITGEDLITAFKLEPSPYIGEILKHLLNLMIEHPEINNNRDLLHAALDYTLDKK